MRERQTTKPDLLIKNGRILTMDKERRTIVGDISITDGRILSIDAHTDEDAIEVIDASEKVVLPGFIQTHVHLCQTLFRGQAEGMALLPWLRTHIWPLEAAHDRDSVFQSALLGCAELLRGGTTSILDMGTVHHTEGIMQALTQSGIRATFGKAMMDAGGDVPGGLKETTNESLDESMSLLESVRARKDEHRGRLRYAFAPRFSLSCSEELLTEVARLAPEHGAMIHTHASENQDEVAIVRAERGYPNVEYLHRIGISGPHVTFAHCVHLEDIEYGLLAESRTNAAHCPSSNLKLGSGIANVARMRRSGINVSIGTDGAAANNNLDMFHEMRLTAQLSNFVAGPGVITCQEILEMATIGGARALGLDTEIGSLEPGKAADLIIVDINKPHIVPADVVDICAALVFSATASDVEATIVNGEVVARAGEVLTMDEGETMKDARSSLARLRSRAQIA